MAIKNPNPNIKDFEVNDNTTWSSNKIADEIKTATGGGLPTPAAGDDGKIVTVVDGEFVLSDPAPTYVELSDILEASETSLVFEDDSITTDSLFDIYTDVFGVAPTNAVVTTGTLTLTFASQTSDIEVVVRVS